MAKKTQLPAKYRARKTTNEEQSEIEAIQEAMTRKEGHAVPYLVAKHEYFSAKEAKESPKEAKVSVAKEEKEPMTIGKTKLGMTVVLTKKDCELLGLEMSMTTRDGIRQVRKLLKLPGKPQRG